MSRSSHIFEASHETILNLRWWETKEPTWESNSPDKQKYCTNKSGPSMPTSSLPKRKKWHVSHQWRSNEREELQIEVERISKPMQVMDGSKGRYSFPEVISCRGFLAKKSHHPENPIHTNSGTQ